MSIVFGHGCSGLRRRRHRRRMPTCSNSSNRWTIRNSGNGCRQADRHAGSRHAAGRTVRESPVDGSARAQNGVTRPILRGFA